MVALQRTKQRPLSMAWNRLIPGELVYALEDGSVHMLTVDTPAAAGTEASTEVSRIEGGVLSDMPASLQALKYSKRGLFTGPYPSPELSTSRVRRCLLHI